MARDKLIEDGKWHEIYTGHYYATEKGWRVGLGDQDLDIQLALYAEVLDMYEATGEEEFEDWPLTLEVSVVVARPGPEWLAKALQSGSGKDPADVSDEQALAESYQYGGGVPVTHILMGEISGGGFNLDKFGRGEVRWFTEKLTHGTVAAQYGPGKAFDVPRFKEDEIALRFAEELLKNVTPLFGMVGFYLDRPVNMAGDDGWSMIADQAKRDWRYYAQMEGARMSGRSGTKWWRIENVVSGHVFGDYPGETEREALLAMVRDAGYSSIEEAESIAPTEPGEIQITEISGRSGAERTTPP